MKKTRKKHCSDTQCPRLRANERDPRLCITSFHSGQSQERKNFLRKQGILINAIRKFFSRKLTLIKVLRVEKWRNRTKRSEKCIDLVKFHFERKVAGLTLHASSLVRSKEHFGASETFAAGSHSQHTLLAYLFPRF